LEQGDVVNIDPNIAAIVLIIALLILLFLGMPIAFVMILVGFGGMVALLGMKGALTSLGMIPFGAILSYTLTVVPMFILMGQFAFCSGISGDLFDVGQKWLSRLPGGLACATVAGCAMFGACTGSSVACCATMGKIAITEMEKTGYNPRLAAGTVAGAGGLAVLIPPSLPAVIYAMVSLESVGKVLVAGILPGILSSLIFISFIVISVKWSPDLAPKTTGFPWKQKFIALKGIWGILAMFTLVMGSMYMGWATPTEAGAVGAAGTLIIALVRRRSTLRDIWKACLETTRQVCMIFTIFIGTTLFGLFLARAGVPMKIAAYLGSLSVPPVVVLSAIILFYIPLGMFLDPGSMILLTTPIVYPTIISLGYHGIWWGIILIILCEIAVITPPVAANLYVVKGVAPHISFEDIAKGALPYVARDLLVIAILIIFPQIALWLPNMMR
jgi:tripartite ATP-independent transporter DctM subunit